MVGDFETGALANPRKFNFNNLVIFQHQNLTTVRTCQVVVMMTKFVCQFNFAVPADLQFGYNAKFFKQNQVSIDRGLVVFINEVNQLFDRQGRMALQIAK